MLLGNNLKKSNCKPEALRYQPSFDLRRNIAKVIAHYSMVAVHKGIMLDIYVDHEIPNYFHGNSSCFLEMFSVLLKLSIASFSGGELYIRVNHESVHQSNSSETELSICITVHDYLGCIYRLQASGISQPGTSADKKIPLANSATLQRLKNLCSHFAGNVKVKKLNGHKIEFLVNCTLQQSYQASRLSLV